MKYLNRVPTRYAVAALIAIFLLAGRFEYLTEVQIQQIAGERQ